MGDDYAIKISGVGNRIEIIKGAMLFLFMFFLVISPLLFGNLNPSGLSTNEAVLFSCIEYDESYMTCSLGSLR